MNCIEIICLDALWALPPPLREIWISLLKLDHLFLVVFLKFFFFNWRTLRFVWHYKLFNIFFWINFLDLFQHIVPLNLCLLSKLFKKAWKLFKIKFNKFNLICVIFLQFSQNRSEFKMKGINAFIQIFQCPFVCVLCCLWILPCPLTPILKIDKNLILCFNFFDHVDMLNRVSKLLHTLAFTLDLIFAIFQLLFFQFLLLLNVINFIFKLNISMHRIKIFLFVPQHICSINIQFIP